MLLKVFGMQDAILSMSNGRQSKVESAHGNRQIASQRERNVTNAYSTAFPNHQTSRSSINRQYHPSIPSSSRLCLHGRCGIRLNDEWGKSQRLLASQQQQVVDCCKLLYPTHC